MTSDVQVARRRSSYLRRHLGTILSAVAVAVFVGVVVEESWAGNPITFDSLLFWIVVGVTYGSVYAVSATGLVVTYTTSGIFNFAQGAIGMFMAFVFWQLHVDWGVQTLIAFLLTVLVVSPLFGALIERILMRRLADAPLVAQIVTTIGLMLALMGLAALIWDPQTSRHIDRFYGTSGFTIGDTIVPWSRFITIVAGIGLAIGLKILLSRTRLGIAMRAVVDNRELGALNGVRTGRVSMFSWALGSAMAAVAGIFISEELSALDVQTLTLVIFGAFAAAIIGRLRNLPMTFAGGIIVGLVVQFQQNFLIWSGRWTTASAAIPMIVLFFALLFLPQARIEGRRALREVAPRVPTLKKASFGMAVLFLIVFVLGDVLGRQDVRRLTLALVTALIMVSLVPLTGWSRQISLAQITFAGAGAFAFMEWAPHVGSILGLIVAALFALPFGILMALPALRLQGLYLALASLAFARMAEFLFFPQPEVFGFAGKPIPPIEILGFNFSQPFTLFGIDFGEDVGTMFLITFLLGVLGVLVVWLRRSRFGYRLSALGDSPVACATLGINATITKVFAFGLSAAIAGFGGALLGVFQSTANVQDFQMLNGLPYLLLLVVGGVAVVSGAVMGGLLLQSFTWLTEIFPNVTVFDWLMRVGPGLAGIGIGRQPSGVIPTVSEDVRTQRAAKRAAKLEPPAPSVEQPREPARASAGGS